MTDIIVSENQYFQGILQLREETPEIISFIANQLAKNKDVWVSRMNLSKTGRDLYLSNNKFLAQLGKKLQESFPGELTISKKLHTRNQQTSKDVYRVTVCFRYVPVRKGMKVLWKGEPYEVKGIDKKISLKHSTKGKTRQITFTQFKTEAKKI